MRARVLTIAIWAGLAASTAAIPYIPPPQPVYEAPIDRALENVAGMEGLEPAQRELLLGRLNLLAYARDDGAFTYLRDGDSLNLAGSVPCSEAPRNMRVPQEGPAPVVGPDDRCAALGFAMGPQDEVPDAANVTPSPDATARLEAARGHYEQALEHDEDNLRARLGYAYVLDRLGRTDDARRELRCILKKGLPRLAEAQSEWEDHAVLTETAAHLEHLATSRSDRPDQTPAPVLPAARACCAALPSRGRYRRDSSCRRPADK
jgi:tetratricopeptide (TPR) repeat protein